ncbi:MAG TPA: nuclear transport factor 2 family protein [Pyrinomonadaceae bacterium]|nr:nuclear transport factor 2 family protein [Pyrinomonadaceae bacterium]
MKLILLLIASFALGAVCFAGISQPDRTADAEAIRAHIGSIFQAFIDGDEQKIYDTHSEDWRGLLGGYPTPIKGIDEYMRANGIEWPKPANAPKSEPYYPPGTGYKMNDFDVHFYTPELAVANFIGEFVRKDGTTTTTLRRFRIMDIYAKRKGNWIQVASHTAPDPAWQEEQTTKPRNITPDIRERILAKRDAVWKAWFSNDRPTLEKLIPEEAIAINSGSKEWSNRAAILASAKAFADSGTKLVKLEFPKTEIQAYGNTVLIYTTYVFETEKDGKRHTTTGRGTEMFVRRGEELVNVGWHLDDEN